QANDPVAKQQEPVAKATVGAVRDKIGSNDDPDEVKVIVGHHHHHELTYNPLSEDGSIGQLVYWEADYSSSELINQSDKAAVGNGLSHKGSASARTTGCCQPHKGCAAGRGPTFGQKWSPFAVCLKGIA